LATRKKQDGPRVLIWDIEASNLSADCGFVFCIGYKWIGEDKIHLLKSRGKHIWDDKDLMQKWELVFNSADLHVAHYGSRFDLPFIQTRRMMHGLEPLSPVPIVDTWRISKYKLKLRNNRLATLASAVHIPKDKRRPEKTPLEPSVWMMAHAGHKPSIKYIEEHCIADIDVLEAVYLQLRSFASSHPNLGKIERRANEACPVCAGDKIQRRGISVTARGRFSRMHCQGCGAWFQLPCKV
jgi:uncharacterized protein YprB with RNaseH-like and TPR domain